jgi:hypothetical protein
MKPRRVQRKRIKGWRMPANTVCITRPGKWHNPYLVCAGRSRKEAVRAFRMGIRGRWRALQKLEGHSDISMLTVIAYFQAIRRSLHELRGKNVCCYCGLDEPCHGDPLLEVANT